MKISKGMLVHVTHAGDHRTPAPPRISPPNPDPRQPVLALHLSTPPPVSAAPQPAPRLAAENLHTCRERLDMRGHHGDGMELIVIQPSWEGGVMQQPTRFHKGDRVVVKETGEEGVVEKVRTGEGDADKYYLDEEYVVRVKSGRWYIRGPLEFEPFDSA